MEKAVLASNEQMKAEAVKRMTLIGLKKEYIDAFTSEDGCEITTFWTKGIKGFMPYCIEDEELDAVMEYEKANPGLVWAVIHDLTNEDGEDWDCFYILYVGNDSRKWEEERKVLQAGTPVAFYKAVSSETYTENTGFEAIKIEVKDGILIGEV